MNDVTEKWLLQLIQIIEDSDKQDSNKRGSTIVTIFRIIKVGLTESVTQEEIPKFHKWISHSMFKFVLQTQHKAKPRMCFVHNATMDFTSCLLCL